MKINIGKFDRMLRLAVAIEIVVLFFYGFIGGVAADILLVMAAFLAVTAFLGASPVYTLLKITTRPKNEDGYKKQAR